MELLWSRTWTTGVNTMSRFGSEDSTTGFADSQSSRHQGIFHQGHPHAAGEDSGVYDQGHNMDCGCGEGVYHQGHPDASGLGAGVYHQGHGSAPE